MVIELVLLDELPSTYVSWDAESGKRRSWVLFVKDTQKAETLAKTERVFGESSTPIDG